MKMRLSGKTASIDDSRIIIRFAFNANVLELVKSIPGRQYNWNQKFWACPYTPENVALLRTEGFEIISNDKPMKEEIIKAIAPKLKPIKITGFGKKLYDFQNLGVSFLTKNNGRGLIADEMGLGKTVQVAAWLHMNRELSPVIIICPSAVKLNWKRELTICMKNPKVPKIAILKGKKAKITKADIFIINYDILPAWYPYLNKMRPQVIVTDECHYYKNNSAKRTKAVKMLAKNVRHFIALSGTPIINRPVEAYNAIKLVNPGLFPNFFMYAKEYCGAVHNGFGWNFNGASNVYELHQTLIQSGTMIRRKKQDVLHDLPDKTRSIIPLEIYNRSTYLDAENDFISFLRKTKGGKAADRAENAEMLTKISTLKQIAVAGKLDEVISWISDFLEGGEKLVVFISHKFVMARLMEAFPMAVNTIENREESVAIFQNDPETQLFIGRLKADGVGITLTAASHVAFIEFPWTPGELSQAEDRVHRITQKEAVTAYYFIAQDTIEEKIINLLDTKRIVLDGVLDGVLTEQSSLLGELLKSY